MGANAATKSFKILDNVSSVLAIELMTAVQALEFRKDRRMSEFLIQVVGALRKEIPPLLEDRILHNDMMAAKRFIKTFSMDSELIDL